MAVVTQGQSSAIRSQPVSPALLSVLETAANAAGVTVQVYSGGQESNRKGEGTGSTRHNHGNAADIHLYKDGRLLDFNDPADRQVIQTFVATAAANGANGIGAGNAYMGPTSLHVGFGPNGEVGGPVTVWGAQGKSANAPDWLREAASGVIAPVQVASGQPDDLSEGITRDPALSVGGLDNAALVDALARQYVANPAKSAFTATPPATPAAFSMFETDGPSTASQAAEAMGLTSAMPSGPATFTMQPYYRNIPSDFGLPENQYGMNSVLADVLAGRDPSASAANTYNAVTSTGLGMLGAIKDVRDYITGLPTAAPAASAWMAASARANPALLDAIPAALRPTVDAALKNAPADKTGFYPEFNPEMGGGRTRSTANSGLFQISQAPGADTVPTPRLRPETATAFPSGGSAGSGSALAYTSPSTKPDAPRVVTVQAPTAVYTSPSTKPDPVPQSRASQIVAAMRDEAAAKAAAGYVSPSTKPDPAPAMSLAEAARAASGLQGYVAPEEAVTRAQTMAAMPMPRLRPEPVAAPKPVVRQVPVAAPVATGAPMRLNAFALAPVPEATPGVSGVRAGPAYGTLRSTDVVGLTSRSSIPTMSSATVPGGYIPGAWGGSDPGSMSPTKTFLGG